MFRTFDEIMEQIRSMHDKKTVAIAAAEDHEVLECAVNARKADIADFILIGDSAKICDILTSLGEIADTWNIIDKPENKEAAETAVSLCAEGKADALMKGLLHTAVFLRALFNKEYNLVPPKALVTQATVCEFTAQDRLVIVTDCAVCVSPTYEEKIGIINNAVSLAGKIGCEEPKVALITPVEVVNPKMPETIEAAMLAKANERGQIKGCKVEGPLAMDNAVSLEAAQVKGITGPVAGQADILVMPNLSTGNAVDKTLRYFAGLKTGSAVMGAKVPVIMTSRSDSAENKLHAVALSVL